VRSVAHVTNRAPPPPQIRGECLIGLGTEGEGTGQRGGGGGRRRGDDGGRAGGCVGGGGGAQGRVRDWGALVGFIDDGIEEVSGGGGGSTVGGG
jgi:hypothetical protein